MSISGIYTRSLTVEANFCDRHAELLIIGELNDDTRHLLADMLGLVLAKEPCYLVVNMRRVRDIDQTALQMIGETAGRLPGARPPVILHPSTAVRRLLTATAATAEARSQKPCDGRMAPAETGSERPRVRKRARHLGNWRALGT